MQLRRVTGRLRTGLIIALGQAGIRSAVAIYALVLIRRMTPASYGEFAFAVSVLSIALFIADGGFTRLLIRDVARAAGASRLAGQILIVRAVSVVVVVTLIGLLSLAGAFPLHRSLLVAFLAALGLQALAVGYESAAIGAENAKRLARGQHLEALVLMASLGVLLAIRPSPSLAVAGMAVAAAAKLAYHVVVALNRGPAPAGLPTRLKAAGWTRQAVPYLLLGALGTIYYRVDIVILHTIRGNAATAPYAVAYRIVDASTVLGAILLATIGPHLSRLHQQGPHLVLDPWRRYVRRTAALLIPPIVVLALAAEPIAGVVFGRRYMVSAGTNLRLLAPGIVFMVLHHINVAVMFADDDQRANLIASLLSALGNVTLTSVLVALDGANGAALATTLSEIALFSSYAVWIRRRCERSRRAAASGPGMPPSIMLNRT